MSLPFRLSPESVLPLLDAPSKKLALKELAAMAAEAADLSEREVFSALMEREHQGCTGMGSGVCVPHARFAKISTPLAVFARLKAPVEFGAADGKPVDLLFLLITPLGDDKSHITALAAASKLLRDKILCEKLRTVNGAQIYPLLTGTTL